VTLEQGLALGVICAGKRIVVPPRTVGFDHELLLGPPEVGNDDPSLKTKWLVDLRWLEASLEDQVVDHILEL